MKIQTKAFRFPFFEVSLPATCYSSLKIRACFINTFYNDWKLKVDTLAATLVNRPGAGKKRSREAGNASSSAGGGSATGGRCRNYAIQVRALDPVDDTHPTPCNCQMAKCVLMQALEKEFDEDEDLEGEVMDLTWLITGAKRVTLKRFIWQLCTNSWTKN